MHTRKKEDNMYERLKHPDEKSEQNRQICKLIDEAYHKKHDVWLACDWHLWKRVNKNAPVCRMRHDFNTVIRNVLNTVRTNDVLIVMGDLVDGEFTLKKELKNVMLEITCTKILVRGNNDLFPDSFYKECGFTYVVDSFVWKDIIFTHIPVKNDHELNIHAHLHTSPGIKQTGKSANYWIPYKNHIDVSYLGGRTKPVNLLDAIVAQPEFSKYVKECPEHFNEYELMETDINMFMRVMEEGSDFVHDPWYD